MNSDWKARASTVFKGLVRLEQWLAIGILITILVTMGLQVFARYVFGSPISWSEEVARLGLIWLTFIAAGFVAARGQHIAVDLSGPEPGPVTDDSRANDSCAAERPGVQSDGITTPEPKRWFSRSRLVDVLVLLSSLMLLIGGLPFVLRVYPVASPSIGLSMTYWYGAASVGLVLLSLHALADLCGIQQTDVAEVDDSNLTAS